VHEHTAPPSAKEATDLLDIVRLTLDPATGAVVRSQPRDAGDRLRADAWRHAERWFVDNGNRTTRLIRRLPQGAEVDRDLIRLVIELLSDSLTDPN
jgi:hypothetical protein